MKGTPKTRIDKTYKDAMSILMPQVKDHLLTSELLHDEERKAIANRRTRLGICLGYRFNLPEDMERITLAPHIIARFGLGITPLEDQTAKTEPIEHVIKNNEISLNSALSMQLLMGLSPYYRSGVACRIQKDIENTAQTFIRILSNQNETGREPQHDIAGIGKVIQHVTQELYDLLRKKEDNA